MVGLVAGAVVAAILPNCGGGTQASSAGPPDSGIIVIHDPPQPPPDAGQPDASAPDAGRSDVDGGAPAEDAGPVIPDAGTIPTIDAGPVVLWDLPMIRDVAAAACTYSNHRTAVKDGASLDVWDVTYNSWESIDGQLQPILIRAFASKPVGASGGPGLVLAHGLGGEAKPDNAESLAALTGMFAIAFTGPGGGSASNVPPNNSEGRPSGYDNGRRMFDTIPDVRGSWFWGHAMAALRAATCLETRSDVDSNRLGITGFSAGGVISLIASSVDDRIKAAVPLSGTHAWNIATQSPQAWQHALLKGAGYDTGDPHWQRLMDAIIAPAATVAQSKSKVLMVDGSTDEFFPLTAFMATWNALPDADKRLSLAANFDHGCYSLTGIEDKQTITNRAALHADGAERMWFKHWFGTDATYAYLPAAPSFTSTPVGATTLVVATVDPGGSTLTVDNVKVWWSSDDSYLYGSMDLNKKNSTTYTAEPALFTTAPNTVMFVDVQYKPVNPLSAERFTLTTPPSIPADLVPHIRDIASCQ